MSKQPSIHPPGSCGGKFRNITGCDCVTARGGDRQEPSTPFMGVFPGVNGGPSASFTQIVVPAADVRTDDLLFDEDEGDWVEVAAVEDSGPDGVTLKVGVEEHRVFEYQTYGPGTELTVIRFDRTPATRKELQERMEFDHPIKVNADGSISEVSGVYAPESVMEEDGELDKVTLQGWEPLTGYSGQYGYSGPVMHESETISGGLAKDILEQPGVYVAVAVTSYGSEEEEFGDFSGWMILRKPD